MKVSISTVLLFAVWATVFLANVQGTEWWTINVVTSDIPGAGTDDKLKMQFVGTKGDSSKINLPQKKKFSQDSKVSFRVKTTIDFGKPKALIVWFNSRKESEPWHLDRIEVKREKDEANYYIFPCHCWMFKEYGEKTLMPAQTRWTVTVHTSKEGHSDPDHVFMQIIGTQGQTQMRELFDPETGFHTGSKVNIDFITEFIGVPKEIKIKQRSSSAYNRFWNLDKIEMVKAQPKKGIAYTFDCNCKLDEMMTSANIKTLQLSNPEWRIVMVTGNTSGAGTDGKVYIQIGGSTGTTRSIRLNNPGDDFEEGDTDVFKEVTHAIGTPKWVKVSLKNDYSWFLSRVELQWTGDVDKKYVFQFNSWLNEKAPEKTIYLQDTRRVMGSEVKDWSTEHQPTEALFQNVTNPSGWDQHRLTNNQINQFQRDGFLANIKVLTEEQCDLILDDYRYFMGDENHPGMHLLYEYHRNQSGDPNQVLMHALGHWRMTQMFHDLIFMPSVVVKASQLIDPGREVKVRFWHDQLFAKPARHGGVVAWHQDYSYWTRTTPMQHLTVHIALDDQTEENGTIEYIPGSHKWTRGNGQPLPVLDFNFKDMEGIKTILTDEERAAFQPVKTCLRKGEASIHHALAVHGSYGNKSDTMRRSAVLNYFADGTKSNTDEELLMGSTVPKGQDMGGQLYPLVYDPAWSPPPPPPPPPTTTTTTTRE